MKRGEVLDLAPVCVRDAGCLFGGDGGGFVAAAEAFRGRLDLGGAVAGAGAVEARDGLAGHLDAAVQGGAFVDAEHLGDDLAA